MVLLHSDKRSLGQPAPDFQLRGVDGNDYSLSSFSDSRVLVVMFICNHCPYVVAIEDRLIELQRDYSGKGVQLVGICANDPTDYPDDSPDNLRKRWVEKSYGFPYLVDEVQDVARAYGAVCTPDLFVYDANRKLAYHGRLDDNWKDPGSVKKRDLREALDALLAGRAPGAEQTPSMGCSIKWKEG
ncbi:MAG: thioredoxin family protein [Candidatus Omnitrophota bacterium]|nr:thioredoxin family protein [Candidatus Omnitrophota bacterium]